MRRSQLLAGTFLLLIVAVNLGCGGTANAPATQPPPSTPAATPSPAPPSTPVPPPTPAPAATPAVVTTFDFVMAKFGKAMYDAGRITLNTSANNGSGSINVSVGSGNTQFTLTFCPFRGACFNVAQFTSSAPNGGLAHVSGNFTFPQKGTWSGIFMLASPSAPADLLQSGSISSISNGAASTAHFVPLGSVTGGLAGFQPGSDTSAAATISIDATDNVSVQLTGAAANASYTVSQCDQGSNGTANCITQATLMTDASGNGKASYVRQDDTPAIWVLTRNGLAQFATGFIVQ